MLAFIVFLIGYTLSQFYRSFLAVIAPEVAQELHLSATDLGNISAAWFVAFALSQFSVGTALDRHGPRRTVPLFMLAGVVGAWLFAKAHSSTEAILGMALIGIGCAPALMAALYHFGRNYPQDRFAMLSALIIGLGTFGNLLGGTPLALASQAFGWRGVFQGLAIITLAAAVLIFVLVRDQPRIDHNTHTDDGGSISGVRETLSIKALWPVWPLMLVSYGILITERGLWVGPYLSKVHGLAPIERGHVIFVMAMAIGAGALAYGPLEKWLKRRKSLTLAGSVVAGTALLALWLMPEPRLITATLLLCIFGFAGMTYGPAMAHVRSFLPDRLLGRGMTFANFLCMSGAAILQRWSGTYVDRLEGDGLAASGVYARVHLALAAVLLLAALLYAFAREQDSKQPA